MTRTRIDTAALALGELAALLVVGPASSALGPYP